MDIKKQKRNNININFIGIIDYIRDKDLEIQNLRYKLIEFQKMYELLVDIKEIINTESDMLSIDKLYNIEEIIKESKLI